MYKNSTAEFSVWTNAEFFFGTGKFLSPKSGGYEKFALPLKRNVHGGEPCRSAKICRIFFMTIYVRFVFVEKKECSD